MDYPALLPQLVQPTAVKVARRLGRERGCTAEELANSSNLPQMTITSFERGKPVTINITCRI